MSPVDRTRLPETGADGPLTFPQITRERLASGLEVCAVEHRAVPLVSVSVLVRGGSAADPADLPGLAALTADMLDEGIEGHDALALADTIARIGGDLDLDVGHDHVMVTLTMLSRFAAEGLALVAKIVSAPSLTADDFERVRTLRLERLRQLRDHPAALAERGFARFLYGDHPYGHLSIGTEEALAACTHEQLTTFHRGMFRPDGATVIVAGNLSASESIAAATRAFSGWTVETDAWSVPRNNGAQAVSRMPPARLAVIRRAAAAQSELRIGHVCASRDTPDYHALLVLNAALGGQFVSRINLNLREDKGYTYGARTAFELRRGPGPFVLQTSVQTDVTTHAISESLRELTEISTSRPVTAEELTMAQAALTRGYARGFETAQQVARAVAQLSLHDLSDSYFEQFVPRVEAISLADVARVAAHYLDPSRFGVVIVGDIDRIGGELESLGLGDPHALV